MMHGLTGDLGCKALVLFIEVSFRCPCNRMTDLGVCKRGRFFSIYQATAF